MFEIILFFVKEVNFASFCAFNPLLHPGMKSEYV